MLGFPTQIRYLLFPVVFSLLLVLLHFVFHSELLVFDIKKILDGEVWRMITGQLLHSNSNHLYLNLAGLALVWAIHGEYYPYQQFVYVVTVGLCIVGLFTVLSSTTHVYYGFSGVLHFLLAWGACIDITRLDKPVRAFRLNTFYHHTGLLLMLGLVIKVIYENIAPPDLELADAIGANVAVEVHAVGVVSALILFFINVKMKKGR